MSGVRLATRDLTKKFGNFTAVDGVSLDFAPGQIHAIVGENGAGKSTYLKLLFGLQQPAAGHIFIDGAEVSFRNSMAAIRSGLGMVQQHFTLVETLSAIDNIMIGAESASFGILNREEAIQRLEKLIPNPALRVPWNSLVSELTVGQRQRIEILKLLYRESKILFLDEPTAVLTPQGISELFAVLRQLKSQGRTIVLITHKLREVLDHCDTYAVLRRGKLVAQGRVQDATAESIVEAMIGRSLPKRDLARLEARAQTVLRAAHVHETTLARGMLKDVSLAIRSGEVVGVAGVEGSGQSSFVEALMGLRSFNGELEILGQKITPLQTQAVRDLGVGLVPEDRHHQALWMDQSCKLNFAIGLEKEFFKSGLLNLDFVDSKSRAWSDEYDVRASSLDVHVGSLSGGNQQKLIFAREVSGRKPRLLICHQPTRGVDIAAIDLIYRRLEALRNEGLGILVLSSELDELMDICDRIYVFFEGEVTAEFSRGGYDRLAIGQAMTGGTHV